MTDAERIAELESIVQGLRSIVDVVRQEWVGAGAWSEYDEAVYARSVAYNLRKIKDSPDGKYRESSESRAAGSAA